MYKRFYTITVSGPCWLTNASSQGVINQPLNRSFCHFTLEYNFKRLFSSSRCCCFSRQSILSFFISSVSFSLVSAKTFSPVKLKDLQLSREGKSRRTLFSFDSVQDLVFVNKVSLQCFLQLGNLHPQLLLLDLPLLFPGHVEGTETQTRSIMLTDQHIS